MASLASLRRAGPRPSGATASTARRRAGRRRGSPPACPPRPAGSAAARPRCPAPVGRRARRARAGGSRLACPVRRRGGAREPERHPVGARKPRAELDRRPVVLGPSERDENRAVGRRVPGNEQRHVARRLGEERQSAAHRERPRPGARQGRRRAGDRRRARSANRASSLPGAVAVNEAARAATPRAASADQRSASQADAGRSSDPSGTSLARIITRGGFRTSGSATASSASPCVSSVKATRIERSGAAGMRAGAGTSPSSDGSCRRIARSSSWSAGLGSIPSSSTRARRAAW